MEGKGVLGIAYSGAFEVLADYGILQQIKNVAGTSAGSIAALMVALEYNATEIKDELFALNYTKFEDDGDYFRLLSRYGYYKIDYAKSFLEELVEKIKIAQICNLCLIILKC